MTSIVRVIARKMDGIQEDLGTRLHFFATAVKNCGTFQISASADNTLLNLHHFSDQTQPYITANNVCTTFWWGRGRWRGKNKVPRL